MRGRYIKQRQQFEREVTALLLRLGAKQLPDNGTWPRFTLQTKAGSLDLAIHTNLWMGNPAVGNPWVSTRFEDPAAARLLVDCNPFSGKWNFHLWHNWTDDFTYGLGVVEHHLRKVLVEVPA